MYPYNKKKARQVFLNISKSKKWIAKKLYTGIGQQLGFIEKAMERLEEMQNLVPDPECLAQGSTSCSSEGLSAAGRDV